MMGNANFGERELDVMGVVWEKGSATAAEVRAALPVDLAYNTVLTILRNLEAKGFVRHEGEGRAHRYIPCIARREARESALARLIDKLFNGSTEALLVHLAEDQRLSSRELRRLGLVINSSSDKVNDLDGSDARQR